jgi:hypothetical protein
MPSPESLRRAFTGSPQDRPSVDGDYSTKGDMMRVVIGTLVAIALLGAGVAIGAGADGDWGRHHDAVVISGGSGATDGGQTVVVRDDHAPGFFFFPFGLLFFFLLLFLVVSFVKRGRRGGHWRDGGGGPAWLEDWHRRAHEGDPGDAETTGSA